MGICVGFGLLSAHVCVLLSCFDGGSVTAPGLVSICKLKRFPSHSEHFLPLSLSLPGTACCLYTCINMRLFLLSPPPSLSLSLSLPSVCLSVCLPACLSVCLSVRLPVCPFLSPTPTSPPPPPLSLSSSPSLSTSLPPSPCVLCHLLVFSFLCVCFLLFFLVFFFLLFFSPLDS